MTLIELIENTLIRHDVENAPARASILTAVIQANATGRLENFVQLVDGLSPSVCNALQQRCVEKSKDHAVSMTLRPIYRDVAAVLRSQANR